VSELALLSPILQHCFESPALGTDNGKYLFHCHLRRDASCGGSSFNIFWSSALSRFLLPFEKPSILLRYSKTASVIPDRQHHCLDPLRQTQLGESLDQQKPSLRWSTAELMSTECKSYSWETPNSDQIGKHNPRGATQSKLVWGQPEQKLRVSEEWLLFLAFIQRTAQSKSNWINVIQISRPTNAQITQIRINECRMLSRSKSNATNSTHIEQMNLNLDQQKHRLG